MRGVSRETAVFTPSCRAGPTTNRLGSTPSDSDARPAASTSSCTTLRSNAVIGSSAAFSPVVLTCSITVRATSTRVDRRSARWPATSSIRRLRSPVADWTASLVSSCSASSTLPSWPTRRRGTRPSSESTMETAARSPSTSTSMSPSRSAMSSSVSRKSAATSPSRSRSATLAAGRRRGAGHSVPSASSVRVVTSSALSSSSSSSAETSASGDVSVGVVRGLVCGDGRVARGCVGGHGRWNRQRPR